MSSAKATKKSAFSCEQCRRRKVKCGGEQPICQRCAARDDLCVYKLSPTLSYTHRLESRVKELEEKLAELEGKPSPYRTVTEDAYPSHHTSGFGGLKLDEKGAITYHGATSFFQPLGDSATGKQRFQDTSTAQDLSLNKRQTLVSNAWRQRALENLSEIPEPFRYLLDTHWCWIHPLFNFIYRPAFTRDLEALGPYYSHTLMNALLSHSTRWAKSDPITYQTLQEAYDGGALFGRHARTMLFDELESGKCTIPTVQALLLLSAQECSSGNNVQAWVYTGIAFRLIDHLGICVDGQRYAGSVHLSDEDVEIRNRLFWSCYFWDKMISLYLGRSPALQHSTVSPPQVMFDDSAESELWYPHGFSPIEGMSYPPTLSHSTSCFVRMCQLSVIFNQILIHMYDPLKQHADADVHACFVREDMGLNKWFDDLPPFLKIDVSALPELAPPSHIVTLNCLYHTFKILLHRPMLSRRFPRTGSASQPNPKHLIECVSSATSTIMIFDLFCRTFGESRCVLSISYAVYIAASIFLLHFQAAPDDKQTVRKLEFCINALERVQTVNPVINSALKLILQAVENLGIELFTHRPQDPEIEQPQNTYVPQDTQPIPQLTQQFPILHGANEAFQLPEFDYFDRDMFQVNPEQLEIVSSIEPIAVTVGALNDPTTDMYEGG